MANIFPKATNQIVSSRPALCLAVVGGLVDAGGLVLLHAEVFARRLPAGAAGLFPARPPRRPARARLPLLPQLRREVSGYSNYPTTQTCMNCHSQIQKNNPRLAAGARQLGHGQADRVGEDPQRARLRLLQPLRARESRRQLRELPRQGQRDERRLPGPVADHGLVPELPSPSRRIRAAASRRTSRASNRPSINLDWKPPDGTTQAELGRKLVHDWKINPPKDCARVPPMKRIFNHPPDAEDAAANTGAASRNSRTRRSSASSSSANFRRARRSWKATRSPAAAS